MADRHGRSIAAWDSLVRRQQRPARPLIDRALDDEHQRADASRSRGNGGTWRCGSDDDRRVPKKIDRAGVRGLNRGQRKGVVTVIAEAGHPSLRTGDRGDCLLAYKIRRHLLSQAEPRPREAISILYKNFGYYSCLCQWRSDAGDPRFPSPCPAVFLTR